MNKEKIFIFSFIAVILIIAGALSLLISNPFSDTEQKADRDERAALVKAMRKITPMQKKTGKLITSAPSISKNLPTPTMTTAPILKKITSTPAPEISQLKIRPTIDPLARTIPSYMKEYTGAGKINLQKGKISFSVKADWVDGQGDTILLLGNFDGSTKKNLFEVIGLRNLLIFETYDGEGLNNSFEAPDAVLDDNYYSQAYDVELVWDFTGEKKIKRIYINGKLNIEVEVEGPAVSVNPKIYIGNVENLVIQ